MMTEELGVKEGEATGNGDDYLPSYLQNRCDSRREEEPGEKMIEKLRLPTVVHIIRFVKRGGIEASSLVLFLSLSLSPLSLSYAQLYDVIAIVMTVGYVPFCHCFC